MMLQVNFKYGIPKDELLKALTPQVEPYAGVAGLKWKIWLINEEESEAAGHYLFENESTLQAFLGGPLAPKLEQSSESSVKQFEVIDEFSKITRGPI
jgi:hypothetical protein